VDELIFVVLISLFPSSVTRFGEDVSNFPNGCGALGAFLDEDAFSVDAMPSAWVGGGGGGFFLIPTGTVAIAFGLEEAVASRFLLLELGIAVDKSFWGVSSEVYGDFFISGGSSNLVPHSRQNFHPSHTFAPHSTQKGILVIACVAKSPRKIWDESHF